MPILYMLCGNTGAGKTTYAHKLAAEKGAIRFSIDPWMQAHYGADYTGQGLPWMQERTARCEVQIWEVIAQLAQLDIPVVIDFGSGSRKSRDACREKAATLGMPISLHYLDTPRGERLRRVRQRNIDKDPQVYALEVTDEMFAYVDPLFEPPAEQELAGGQVIHWP